MILIVKGRFEMFIKSDEIDVQMVQFIDADGNETKSFDGIDDEDLITMYKWMVKARIFDQRAMQFQRQGRIGTYAPFQGQEAAQVGSAYALRESDWIYPSYREAAASFVHGQKMEQMFSYAMGSMRGTSEDKANIFPVQIIIAAQCLHGVGGAWASKYKGEDDVSVVYVGDGGTSQGDFHEALNFSGVYELPIVFFVQNNQWAISTPIEQQTASKSIAQKALAYGIDGVQVDGNDIIAVYKTMQKVVERAREGKPTLVEAITYRQGPHTTADDEKKYRTPDIEEKWNAKDPIQRTKQYLMNKGLWTEEQDEAEYKQAEKEVLEAFERAATAPKAKLDDVLDTLYEENPVLLEEQLQSVREEL